MIEYTPRTWANGEVGNTPLAAAALNNIEDGVNSAVTGVNDLQAEVDALAIGGGSGDVLASDFGVVGDGVTDDAAALNALLELAAADGVRVTLAPKSVVLVQSTVFVPSGSKLNLNGATIRRGPSGSGATLSCRDESNILIWDGLIDGNKAAYAPATEWRHNIILDNSHNITIRDVASNSSKGDGIYVGGTDAHCTNIDLFNVTCDGNHRQGLSIIGVDGFTATSCRFINTAGTAPESGVDVEPNLPGQTCINIRFVNCTMTGNAGHGYLEALNTSRTARQGEVTLVGCTLDDNAQAGVRLTESEGFKMIGGSVSRNYNGVLHNTNIMRHAKFIGVDMFKNDQHGIAISAVYTDLLFTNCTIDANGQTTTGDGANIAPSGSSSNLRFIGNLSGTSPQRNGITLGANCAQNMLVGNSYGGNTGVARSGESVITLDLDSAGKKTVTGAKGGNAALTSLLTQLATLGLITNSTT